MLLLLLQSGGAPFPPLPLDELVEAAPDPAHGYRIQRPADTGVWRWVLELADPTAAEVGWHDITDYYCGDRHQFGADDYMGKARARLVTVQLQADDDRLAPWGQDTTDTFGVNVPLGAGLLMRAAMARVSGGVTVEWEPVWTGRVESWGDASAARGQIRTHIISVVDTISDLANVPTIVEDNLLDFPDWLADVLLSAGWNFGHDVYGDTPSTTLQDETPQAASARLDAGHDPRGRVWRSLRTGRLVSHPAPWDTTNTNRYPNPLLDVYPDGLVFSYSPDVTQIEYIADDDQQPFGVSDSIAGVLNSFAVTMPTDDDPEIYYIDDPVSVERFGVRPFTATWNYSNPAVVDDLLAARAFASKQALPLRTTLDLEGFWSALAIVDHLDPVTVYHQTRSDGLVVTSTGIIRNIVEERTWRGDGLLSWQSTIQVDINTTGTAEALLPVESLAFAGSESPLLSGYSSAEFTWVNPVQPSITPTNIQWRVIGQSPIWTTAGYSGTGADGATINWLDDATNYRFQVRLIREVDGVITNFSVLREVRFTTAARIYPIPIPGDTPDDTNVDMPPFDDCEDDVSIELQENAGGGWVTIDTFSGSEIEQDADGHWHLVDDIPNSVFSPGAVYRFAGFCGDDLITLSPEFNPPDDWDDPCVTPPALSQVPFTDDSLLVYVPQVCVPDIIKEAVSGIEGVKGDAYGGLLAGLTDPTARALRAISQPAWDAAPFGIVAYGECPQITGATGDKTITCRVNIADDTEECVLFECAGMTLRAVPVSGGGWRASVVVYKPGVTVTLPSSSVLDADTQYVILATFELATGTVNLYIDSALDNSVGGTDNLETITALPIWRVGAPPDSWITDCGLFDSVIVPTPPFDPILDIGWHSAYWADGPNMLALGYSNGASVSPWPDEIGSEDMTGSSKPTFITSDLNFNNHRSVNFNATIDHRLEYPISAASAQSQPFAYVVIARFESLAAATNTTGPTLFDGGGPAVAGTQARLRLRNPGAITYAIVDGGTESNGGTPDLNPHCFLAYFNGASSRLEVDGSTVISAVNVGTAQWDGTSVGYANGAAATNWRMQGQIAFKGIYFGDPESDPDWPAFKTWVAGYYGITIA